MKETRGYSFCAGARPDIVGVMERTVDGARR
jgi:hypothetical protein